MKLNNEQKNKHKLATHCYLCGESFEKKQDDINEIDYDDDENEIILEYDDVENDKYKKVRDHDHLTGEYRGAAHNKCNLKYGWRHVKIPVIFHNLKGYDSHFIIKAFESDKKIKCIPNSTEKYISFDIDKLRFIDSFSFMASSLEKLVDSLTSDKNNFKHFNEHFKNYTQEQRDILTKKGVFPYDFMTSYDKFNYDNFPSIEECYNQLKNEDMKKTTNAL